MNIFHCKKYFSWLRAYQINIKVTEMGYDLVQFHAKIRALTGTKVDNLCRNTGI